MAVLERFWEIVWGRFTQRSISFFRKIENLDGHKASRPFVMAAGYNRGYEISSRSGYALADLAIGLAGYLADDEFSRLELLRLDHSLEISMDQNLHESSTSRITPEQALFLATLPDCFCNPEDAIGIYAFINRVAPIPVAAVHEAIAFGRQAKLVEADNKGGVRLVAELREKRDVLKSQEGYFEVAVGELADWIFSVQHPASEI